MKKKTAKKAAPKAGKGKQAKKHDGKSVDALDLLKADHELVKGIFKKYQSLVDKGGSKREKMALVKEACNALAVHAQIEEEIFYPALQGAADNSELAEAFVEHQAVAALAHTVELGLGEDRFHVRPMGFGGMWIGLHLPAPLKRLACQPDVLPAGKA